MSIELSVIIPTYRPSSLLHDCLLSISKQTLSTQDYEVIIVLNGDLAPLYRQYVENEMGLFASVPIKLVCSEIASVSNARNIALDLAKGKYICFVDDDDVISDTYLENLCFFADSESIVVSNVLAFQEDNMQDVVSDYITQAYLKLSPRKKVYDKLVARSFFSSSCCKLIPSVVIGTRRFDIHFKIGEDSLFMALLSNKIKKVVFADDTAVYYRRVRISSASHQQISFGKRFLNSTLVSLAFVGIYLKAPREYNFLFFVNRILAPFHRLF